MDAYKYVFKKISPGRRQKFKKKPASFSVIKIWDALIPEFAAIALVGKLLYRTFFGRVPLTHFTLNLCCTGTYTNFALLFFYSFFLSRGDAIKLDFCFCFIRYLTLTNVAIMKR